MKTIAFLLIFCSIFISSYGQERSRTPYRYLENDRITLYYETDNVEAYKKLIPKEFDMPSRCLVHVFVIDFYKIDNGLPPYKERQQGVESKSKRSIIVIAERVPNRITLKFGEGEISTKTTSECLSLELTPSKIIGVYYLKNTISFRLTREFLK